MVLQVQARCTIHTAELVMRNRQLYANFANLESFVKLIHLKYGPLHCHLHGQHTSRVAYRGVGGGGGGGGI